MQHIVYLSFLETASLALTISNGYVIATAVTPAAEPARNRRAGGSTLKRQAHRYVIAILTHHYFILRYYQYGLRLDSISIEPAKAIKLAPSYTCKLACHASMFSNIKCQLY